MAGAENPNIAKCADAITRYAESGDLRACCEEAGINWRTFLRTRNANTELQKMWDDAKEWYAQRCASLQLEASGDQKLTPGHAGAKSRALQWLAQRQDPKTWGDKQQLDVNMTGALDLRAAIAVADQRMIPLVSTPQRHLELPPKQQVIDYQETFTPSAPDNKSDDAEKPPKLKWSDVFDD